MVALYVSRIEFVKMVRSQFTIGHLVFENTINHHQKSMSYCDDGLLLALSGDQPMVKGRQVRSLLSNGRPTASDQISTQPLISFSDLAAFALPGTLVVPRTRGEGRCVRGFFITFVR
jgi:hypothetical protein